MPFVIFWVQFLRLLGFGRVLRWSLSFVYAVKNHVFFPLDIPSDVFL